MDVGVGCMRYFGIRSYLDNFYDRRTDQNLHGYNQNKFGATRNRPRFSSRWWKVILWCGSLLVIAGFFLLLIGLILPRKQVDVADPRSTNPDVIIVDREALAYNSKLDTSHLIGVCFIVIGGILFALSLLMPTFCHMWCASGDLNDETDPLRLKMEVSNSEQVLPVRSILKSVQPLCPTDSRTTTSETFTPTPSH